MLLAPGVGERRGDGLVRVLDRHRARDLGDLRQALRLARLEQLDDTRQTVRDVRAGDPAGVERPHRQLGAGLADRLRGDDPDGVADLSDLAGRHRAAVARLADPGRRLALQHRTDRHAHDLTGGGLGGKRLHQRRELAAVDLDPLLDDHRAVGPGDRERRDAADQVLVRLDARTLAAGLRLDLDLEDRAADVLAGAAIILADDHVLRDVDEPAGQVARVGRPQRRVRESLAGAVRRDEVLEHVEALHEVGLDRPLDDLALRIRHQAAHAGELTDLLERAAGPGVGHHEDRVELVEMIDHRLGNLVGGLDPQARDGLVALLLVHLAVEVLGVDLRERSS